MNTVQRIKIYLTNPVFVLSVKKQSTLLFSEHSQPAFTKPNLTYKHEKYVIKICCGSNHLSIKLVYQVKEKGEIYHRISH